MGYILEEENKIKAKEHKNMKDGANHEGNGEKGNQL